MSNAHFHCRPSGANDNDDGLYTIEIIEFNEKQHISTKWLRNDDTSMWIIITQFSHFQHVD